MSNIGMGAPAGASAGALSRGFSFRLSSSDSDQPSLWRSLFHAVGHPPAIPHAGVAFALTA